MYFWGEPDASIQFCEDKYIYSSWIAEYYNTLTALFYILVGLLFIRTKIAKIAWAVIGVGVGSVLLHGTLRCYGQWADEISMLCVSFTAFQYFHPTIKSFILPTLIIIYAFLHHYFIFFFTLFILMNIPLLYITYKRNNIYGRIYLFCFGMGFVCWCLDQCLCDYVQDFYLHAWWHIWTAIGILFALLELLNYKAT